jgi:hypothetical protein
MALPETSQNCFVSPEHKRKAQILVKKENQVKINEITYLGNCKPSNRLNDTLEVSNWCLKEPKEHAKRSRWLDGQLVQQATINTELQVEVLVVLMHDCLDIMHI